MNEVNLNAWSAGLDKNLKPVGNSKNASSTGASSESDTAQFSQRPDLSAAEASVEKEFTERRLSLESEVSSPSYPPLETIDRLAQMLAINLNGGDSE